MDYEMWYAEKFHQRRETTDEVMTAPSTGIETDSWEDVEDKVEIEEDEQSSSISPFYYSLNKIVP